MVSNTQTRAKRVTSSLWPERGGSQATLPHLHWILQALLLVGWLVASQPVWAASLEATVNSNSVVEGESIALYLEGVDLTTAPDVSGLYKDFEVLDSRTGEQISIVNNKRTAKNIWRFELIAKNVGQSVIPAFTADGVSSQPLVINVQARNTPGVKPRDNIFFELSVDQAAPYVQSQVILTVHLFDGANIASGTLNDPESPALQIQRLEDGRQRIEERDGVEYRVITRRYALFPQRSGELSVPPLQLSANIKDLNQGGGGILRYSQTRRVSIRSESLTLNVQPRPTDSTAGWWLPVSDVSLTSEWSADIGQAVVGEPLTRTLKLQVRGATSTQLPEIKPPVVAGLKIYPDTPVLDSRNLATGLISARQEKWSLIPQRAGELVLPEVTIKWWDTVNNAERETVLASETIMVTAASVGPMAQMRPDAPVGADTANDLAVVPAGGQAPTEAAGLQSVIADEAKVVQPAAAAFRNWRVTAIIALIGWLMTAVAWLVWGRRAGSKAQSGLEGSSAVATAGMREHELLQAVEKASVDANYSVFRERIMQWAQLRWRAKPPVNPAQIGERLNSAALSQALRAAEAGQYSSNPKASDLKVVFGQLKHALQQGEKRPRVSSSALPQL